MFAVVMLSLTACVPITLTSSGGGTNPCPAGTWTVESQTFTSALPTAIGNVNITSAGPGVTVNLTDTTWDVDVDQSLSGSVSTPWGTASGTVHVTGEASGTYTKTATTLTFTLVSVSGSVEYDVTVGTNHLAGTLSLADSGLEKLVGFSATANYMCFSNKISVVFPSFWFRAHD